MPVKIIDVESEFDKCVESIGGQRLSQLVGPSPNFNNADYLFREHKVIAELKTLEENKGKDENLRTKIHELYNVYLNKGKTDLLIYGEVEINANDVSRDFGLEIMELFRRPIQGVIKKANKQIRQTKEHLGLRDHFGLLLLVNDGHKMLNPDQVKWILANTFKRNSYSSIDAALFFTVNLKARHPAYQEDLLIWARMDRPGIRPCPEDFYEELRIAWFNHYRTILGSVPINEYIYQDGDALSEMENIQT